MKNLVLMFSCLMAMCVVSCDDTSINSNKSPSDKDTTVVKDTTIVKDTNIIIDPPISPSENLIIYNRYDESDGWSIYSIKPDGTNKKKVAGNAVTWGHSYKNKITYTNAIYTGTTLVANADGTNSRTIITKGQSARSYLSYDGRKVVHRFFDAGPKPGPAHVMLSNYDGNETRDVTSYSTGLISPDGTKLLQIRTGPYIAPGETSDSLFIVDINGSNSKFLTAGVKYADLGSAWSPDGKKIACRKHMVGNFNQIIIVNADGSGSTTIGYMDRVYADISWSPDSKAILCVSAIATTGSERIRLTTINIDGSNHQEILESKSYSPMFSLPQWSPDGKFIVYSERYKDKCILRILDVSTKQIKNLDESSTSWENNLYAYWKK